MTKGRTRPTYGGAKLDVVAGADGLYELRCRAVPQSNQAFWEKWSRLTVADRARIERQHPGMKEEVNGDSLIGSSSGDIS